MDIASVSAAHFRWLFADGSTRAPGCVIHGGAPANGEEAALSRVGPDLYEKIFKHYTKKQWDKYPAQLDAEIFTRLPYREDNDDR